jgi:hypothetical protein
LVAEVEDEVPIRFQWQQMVMIGELLKWLCGIVIVALAGLFAAVMLRHNLRIWRVRRAYRTLPTEANEQVLQLIRAAARERTSVTFLRLDDERKCDGHEELLQSHVGGVPYAEAGEQWPIGKPGTFLLQVLLDEPSLGQQWQGRLLTVFLVFDIEQVVRSYAAPALDKYVPLAAPVAPLPCIRLTSVRLPVDGQGEDGEEGESEERRFPATPTQLCELVPTIPELLKHFTDDRAGLLSQILCPNIWSYDLTEWVIAYEGGDPMLIQNPHDPICEECGTPMRFLFQFGEIIRGVQLADAGVCYVYGCDQHLHHCKGFVDSH